ncbi:MAG: acetyl-CoA carboxylase biotin carboxylase subunit [Chloroflexi bacterium]|nr:MAG: acetyl-CoA carboxylase biotin carboxylase subunit [Chloroflexota bacterium]MBL1193060.1 acetyl-CoA carboxylase biotin carboxylase subunit [Chloroflexota bacterium]NOH10353.1 acetyl-CoA carboxylase biotin carboxylase subunit [Chloroflexota bacterium]
MPPEIQPPFSKILIANRGEIAVRLIRACREMGIVSVAVYSEADANALHTRTADEAVLIGAAEASESYLNIERVVDAAKESGAEAIHPGYGFLAENPGSAQAVADASLTFIGPSPEAMRAMGDKAAARTLMGKAGVPLVPGYQGEDDDESLQKAANDIGYPVLLKAAAGGGGKGMRVVENPDELEEAIGAARREAQNAFGDPRMIVEKYVTNARHVEIQVLADSHGNTLHLFERECSIQRRHQKIIEETPSPLLDDELRDVMGKAAVAAAEAVSYVNAGTVEFIVDPDTRQFYFLEMNTRLQVEHPITEMLTGLDLVQWQIRIAAGEKLPLTQDELSMRGHAIECRLYAEDPASGFLPATGIILAWQPPDGPGVRVDSGISAGTEVGVYYDPLLAKIIVQAEDRPAAIQKMRTALRDTVVLGLTTNREFLLDVLVHETFQKGTATTAFIAQHMNPWLPDEYVPVEALIAAAISEFHSPSNTGANLSTSENDPYSPWKRLKGFRMGMGQ